ncbi:MAG: GNAT family N-acetyltransferase, partial [Gorillibacterium sp.]|nr:GNAT family N-acetyltransferase [Gorillibacterium sp.]
VGDIAENELKLPCFVKGGMFMVCAEPMGAGGNESWGGGNSQRTAESVEQDMENSINLHAFLAVDGDEVVGFCSFSHYRNDEGALYVPLLNVRPDYHSKKIGKALILKSVETTVEMGWPRLDLFTWAGNTKAVPMYKKCGFFWEKKDDGVHLMNFIPTILQTEALKPYMEVIDWYADSTRVIEIKPDGQEREGRFDCFTYSWEREGQTLRVEFEKTGRGIRTLDTPDYLIETEIAEHDLVFDRSYSVRYHIRSKTGQPVVCEINGRDDKNIRFELSQMVTVTDHTIVEGEFFVDAIQEEQSDWKTHPVVMSEWKINGRKAEFRTGIAPKFPAKLSLSGSEQAQYLGMKEELYVNLVNHFNETTTFTFELPSNELIEFDENRVATTIPAKGKASVNLSYRLKKFGVYATEVSVSAQLNSGTTVPFKHKLSWMFKGLTGRFDGEDNDYWYANNGASTLALNKKNNDLWVRRDHYDNGTWWSFPKLGKPYSAEFSKKKAESVRVYAEDDVQVMEALYLSEDFPGLSIRSVGRLQPNGMIEHYYILDNESGDPTADSLQLMESFRFEPNRMILPYDGSYLDLHEPHAGSFDHWEISRISENWLFSRGDKLSRGLCWNPCQTLVKSDWFLGLEHPIGNLPSGQSIQTQSTYLAIGTFTDWWDFRSFARQRREQNIPALTDHLELRANAGNPFIADKFEVEVLERKNKPMDGQLSVTASGREIATVHLTPDSNEHRVSFADQTIKPGATDRVVLNYAGHDVVQERSTVVFAISDQSIQQHKSVGTAGEILAISNEVLSLEAAPAFGNVAYSLKYKGQEWLDTSFPTPGPRSWCNPWHGGLGMDVQGMSSYSLQEEARSGDFASLNDSLGNDWSGIRLTTDIKQHEVNRGLKIEQYYLLLPGAPVLCKVNRIVNETGVSYPRFQLIDRNYFLQGESQSSEWMKIPGENRYHLAINEMEIEVKGLLRIGSDHHSAMLHIAYEHPDTYGWGYTNNLMFHPGVMHRSTLPNGSAVWTKPVFYLFGDQKLKQSELTSLTSIRFSS